MAHRQWRVEVQFAKFVARPSPILAQVLKLALFSYYGAISLTKIT